MVEILRLEIDTELKKEEWQEILKRGEVSIFQTPEMKEVYEKTHGYEPVCLGERSERDGALFAVLLGVVIESKSGLLAPLSRWSTARGGPCFLDKHTIYSGKMLLERFEKEVSSRGSLYSRIYPLCRGNKFCEVFQSENWRVEEVYDFISDLTLGSDYLWKRMKAGKRKNIRRAEKRFKIETTIANDKKGKEAFLKLYGEVCRSRGLIPTHESFFDAVLDVLVKKGYAQIFLANQDGESVASRIALTYQDTVYDWFAGSSAVARKSYANDKLLWDTIVWTAEKGYKNFYYGGAETSPSVRGIFEYKRRFGGELVAFNRYVKVHRPIHSWLVDKMLPLYKKITTRKE